jgi:EKC/KEOPS complex subunit PCC1/LAGE3
MTQTIRLARLTINSFLENIDLVVRTLGEYGDEADALAQS